MANGQKAKSKLFFTLIVSFLAIVLLAVTFITTLPSLLSSHWGKHKLLNYLNSTYRAHITCDRLSVGWFSPVEIINLNVVQEDAQFRCDIVKTEATLLDLLLRKNFKHLYLDRPLLTLKGSLLSWFAPAPQHRAIQTASFSHFQPLFVRLTFPYKGSIECTYGKIELYAQGLDPVVFDEISCNVENSSIEDTVQTHLSCLTLQKGIKGKVHIDATFSQMHGQNAAIKANVKTSRLPVGGVDELIGVFHPSCRGLIEAIAGETADLDGDVLFSSGNFDIDLTASSPNGNATLSIKSENGIASLKGPASCQLKILPAFFTKLAKTDPRLSHLSLKEAGLFTAHLTQFSSPIPQSLGDLVKASFDLSIASSTPLSFECEKTPLVLNEAKITAVRKGADSEPIRFNATASLATAQAPAACTLQGLFDPASGLGNYTCNVSNLPVSLVSTVSGYDQLPTFLGQTMDLRASGDIGKEKTLKLSLNTPLLSLQEAVLTMDDRILLQSPCAFRYLLEHGQVQGKINTFSLPPSRLEDMRCDVEATCEQFALNTHVPLTIKNSNARLSIHTLHKIDLKASMAHLSMIPFEGTSPVSLQDIALSLLWDGRQKNALLSITAASGSLALKSTLTNVQWDKLEALTANSVLEVQKLPTSFLDALVGQPLCTPLLGQTFSSMLKIQSKSTLHDIAMTVTSPLLNMKSDFTTDGKTLSLKKGPTTAQWMVTPEGYRTLDTVATGTKGAPAFDLKETTTFQLSLSKLSLPLSPQAWGSLTALQCVGKLTNPSIAVVDKSSQDTLLLSSLDLAFDNSSPDKPLHGACTANVSSQSAQGTKSKTGAIAIKGTLDRSFDAQGAFQIALQITNFPARLLDMGARLKGRTDYPFTKIFGESLNASLQSTLSQLSGPLAFTLNSPNMRFSLDGQLQKGTLLLKQPIYTQMQVTKEMSQLFLKEINPLSLTYFYSEAPVTVEIPAQGFSLPLSPFNASQVVVPTARIELGKIACRNEGNVNIALGLLKTKQFEKNRELLLWFAPLDLHIKQGIIDIERTEILLAETFDIALWGTVSLPKTYVDMVLGLTAQALAKAFGIKNLPEDYVLTIPLKGPADDVQINSSKATAKIALLLASQQKALTDSIGGKGKGGAILGGIMQQMAKLPDNGTVPPAKHPFPWERGKTSFKEVSDTSHKRHFKSDDKPLKQILKVLR